VDEVIDEFARGLQEPKAYEGPYKSVVIASTPDEVKAAVKSFYIEEEKVAKKK